MNNILGEFPGSDARLLSLLLLLFYAHLYIFSSNRTLPHHISTCTNSNTGLALSKTQRICEPTTPFDRAAATAKSGRGQKR